MKTSIQEGRMITVAATTVAEGESVEIATVGVYELPKLASAVIAAGARVAWDDTAKQVVLPGTGMMPIGIATVLREMVLQLCASGSMA